MQRNASNLTPGERWISTGEVALGAFLVIGHNVFHIVPNEVPILFVLFWISLRLRDGGWAALKRPQSWGKTILIAVVAAAVLQLGSELVIQPLASTIWHSPEHVSSVLQTPSSGWKSSLRSLAIVWVFAAFGEELGYRGYLLTRAADLGNRSKLAWVAAMVYVAVLFGFGHFYKGPAGVIDSTYSGLVLGGAYLLTGRNLWASILAHGLTDTAAVVAVFMGWAN
jgi:membrane protease YdiL (CAAX protease family)